jgi:proteasome assembly chaperone 3
MRRDQNAFFRYILAKWSLIQNIDMIVPPNSAFPVQTSLVEVDVDEEPTKLNFLLSLYADRLLVIVSQIPSLGTIISAEKDSILRSTGNTYAITTLIGSRDDPSLELCARRLVETCSDSGCQLPLLLCLGISKGAMTPKLIKKLEQLILKSKLW